MARLVLSLDGQVMAEYNMNKERYTIGRLPDNDIRIDNAAVSGHHSLIINILNDSFLEDLNSTNGTYVNGKLIKKHALQHGDVITVGHHQLRFVEDDEQQDEFEKTMVIQPSARPVEKLRTAQQAASTAAVTTAAATPKETSKDVTGSIAPPPGAAPLPAAPATVAAAAATPKSEVGRLPTVDGWYLADVGYGGALIRNQNRRGTYEVYAGDFIPGLGRIDAIRKQDGHWVVVTSKGLITSR